MNLVARVRHVLARRPWLYWLGVLLLAAIAGLVVADAAAGVNAARRSWGVTRPVVVAVADVAPGEALGSVTDVRPRPEPMVPAEAVSHLPAGATARQRIAAGEIVTAHDVTATAGPQALIPDGWRAVPVAEPVPSGAAVGDEVAVASGGIVVAGDGVIVATLADGVLVAVPADVAAQVAQASATAELTLLLKP
jgi:SAF domain